MENVSQAPAWLLRPLPANAAPDAKLDAQIDKLAKKLPESLGPLSEALNAVRMYREYDAAANRASAHVWQALPDLYAADVATRSQLLDFAADHMAQAAQAKILRRLAKDPALAVRSKVRTALKRGMVREVALPPTATGAWDPSGWLKGLFPGPLARHPQGKKVLAKNDLPQLPNVLKLRELLGIKSGRQLGFSC